MDVLGERKAMIKAQDLIEKVEASPFRPFRLTLTSGQSFEVTHPDQMMIFNHKIILGVGGDGRRRFERDVHCGMLHIAAIEDTQKA